MLDKKCWNLIALRARERRIHSKLVKTIDFTTRRKVKWYRKRKSSGLGKTELKRNMMIWNSEDKDFRKSKWCGNSSRSCPNYCHLRAWMISLDTTLRVRMKDRKDKVDYFWWINPTTMRSSKSQLASLTVASKSRNSKACLRTRTLLHQGQINRRTLLSMRLAPLE